MAYSVVTYFNLQAMISKGMLGSQIRSVEYKNQLLQSEIIHHSPCQFRIANR